MDLIRNCPSCNKLITYKTKSQFNDAIKKNRICKLCANRKNPQKPKKYLGELKRICYNCKNEIFYKKYYYFLYNILPKDENKILCKSCAESKFHAGKLVSLETRKKISISKIGKKRPIDCVKKMSERMIGEKNPMYNSHRIAELNPFYGKKHSMETRKKISNSLKNPSISRRKQMRMSAIKRLRLGENGKMLPSYNIKSIPILEQKAKELNITDLQHAENGGEFYIKELGYWVDGYSQKKNIVIEYYENHHKKQIERDERRKQEIVDFLKCEFYEIKEWN